MNTVLFLKNTFFANAFISKYYTQTTHIKSFYSQQHCCVSLQNLTPWRDSNPGLLVPVADAMFTAPRRQGRHTVLWCANIYSIEPADKLTC
jgi:hypothetical protein